jgi:hypothetical protein
MPHSSGGGSHGGGFHGGSHGGSSGNRVSTHYYPGARRYRRVYHDGRNTEEYVYARSKPSKTGIGTIVFIAIFAAVFMGLTFMGTLSDAPKKLSPKYMDDPAIHDDIGVIDNEEGLLAEMKKFHETTMICPVVYTVTHEVWLKEPYGNLEDYTMHVYTSNFSDEQHFVIVYSVPESQVKDTQSRIIKVPDYSWEAVQGDETDPIITKSFMRMIGNGIQDDLEAGKGADEAFINAFRKANSQAGVVKPFTAKWIFKNISGLTPLVLVAGFFFVALFFTIKSYRKEKDFDYEEVPLDAGDAATAPLYEGIPGANGSYRSLSYAASDPNTPKAVKIISIVFIIPFVLIGIGTTITGVTLFTTNVDKPVSIFILIFGIVWLSISLLTMIKLLTAFGKGKKDTENPLTAEYPKAEMPTADYPDGQPITPVPERSEIDTSFYASTYGSAKSDYDAEDEDYKRMKRKGYE